MAVTACTVVCLQEASFQEFCARPENQRTIQKEHSQQLCQQIRAQQKHDALVFRDKVGSLALLHSISSTSN